MTSTFLVLDMRVFILLVLVAVVSGVYKDPHVEEGHSAMVHLFEWPWTSIAAECEEYVTSIFCCLRLPNF